MKLLNYQPPKEIFDWFLENYPSIYEVALQKDGVKFLFALQSGLSLDIIFSGGTKKLIQQIPFLFHLYFK
jgi:hypothetical protein